MAKSSKVGNGAIRFSSDNERAPQKVAAAVPAPEPPRLVSQDSRSQTWEATLAEWQEALEARNAELDELYP